MSEPHHLAYRPDPRFFVTRAPLTIIDAVAIASAEVVHSDTDQRHVDCVSPLHRAGAGGAVYIESKKALSDDLQGDPALVLTTPALAAAVVTLFPGATVATCATPRAGFASLGRALHQSRMDGAAQMDAATATEAQISPTAHIAPTAVVMAGAEIMDEAVIGPYTVIGPGVVIGPHTQLGSHCSVTHAIVGGYCRLASGVRIGEAGFGYVPDDGTIQPVPQLGRVMMSDHVDLGANTTVDRGALEDTVIGEGTKIDNLVMIAHNCRLGKNVMIASQTGISGSCTVGDGVMIGGQAGMANHLTIGAGAVISAKSGLMKDIPPGERWGGIPAKPAREWMKDVAALSKLTKRGTT